MYPTKSIGLLLALSLVAAMPLSHGAAEKAVTSVNDIIDLGKMPGKQVRLSDPVDYVPSDLKASIMEHPDQTSEDTRNLNVLWQTVVARNPVIQFSLKQLATPPELRYAHQSIMSRTLSGLLSGAALLPMAMGADAYTAGAASVGANMVDRAVQNNRTKDVDPAALPSDTELVELSGIVQDLQQTIVEHYFAYKASLLEAVKQDQLANVLYSQYQSAQNAKDPVNKLWLKHLYQNADMACTTARQEAKRHYLVLERLVGVRGMQNLRFESDVAVTPEPETIALKVKE